jgi:cysteine desulfurase
MAVKFPIFMDAQSTTPCDPRVVEAMLPYFTEKFGHPASRNHPFGWEAEGSVDAARAKIAKLIGGRDPKEVVFTSGGTEAINLALKGAAEMYREKGTHIVTTVVEQRAGIDTCKRLERQGFTVSYVPVGPNGLVDVEEIRKALTDRTILPTTRSAPSRTSAPSVGWPRKRASSSTPTPLRPSARSRWMSRPSASICCPVRPI